MNQRAQPKVILVTMVQDSANRIESKMGSWDIDERMRRKDMKKILNHIFVDGLSGMASGLFATLIIGTIIQQNRTLVGGTAGGYLVSFAKIASAMTGAGIGVGVASKFKSSVLVTVSAASAGMVGAFAGKILRGSILLRVVCFYPVRGNRWGAFCGSYVAIEIGR